MCAEGSPFISGYIAQVMVLFQSPFPAEFRYRSVTRTFVVKITKPTAVFPEKEAVVLLFASELVSRTFVERDD